MQQTVQSGELLLGLDSYASSYGLYMPSYLYALQMQEEQTAKNGPYRSLLVGALSPDTIREYATTVRTIHPDAEIHVIDLEGGLTRETMPDIVTFHEGDALQLPFPDGYFNSLHTNFLLDMLEDPKGRPQELKRQQFLTESFRVLGKGGMLAMIEEDIRSCC